jgi:O-antigen chain-terminating methyltransferase
VRLELQPIRDRIGAVTQEFSDTRGHWNQWRLAWEQKLAANEIHFLRSVSELQAAFQHRVTLLDQDYRELARIQHGNFEAALKVAGDDIQKRLWDDLSRIRTEYETIIHAEIRMLRQKSALTRRTAPDAGSVACSPAAGELSRLDWMKFAEKFRGSEEYVRERQRIYAGRFHGCEPVLDIGCGRGEMLEVFREAGISSRGIDLSAEAVAMCRNKGVVAEQADLFEYLDRQPANSLGGIVCSQVVEHLPPERIPELVRLAHESIRHEGLLAVETPNPECLAIFASHFYLDPTHTRPIPPPLMGFYLEEAGFGRIETERLYPAVETMPSLAGLPEDFRKDFFGSLDYVIFSRKL